MYQRRALLAVFVAEDPRDIASAERGDVPNTDASTDESRAGGTALLTGLEAWEVARLFCPSVLGDYFVETLPVVEGI